MFARTPRLLLRPGWREDAPALFAAIGHERVVRNLANAPWPYRLSDAEAFLAGERRPSDWGCLIFLRSGGAPELIGGIGLASKQDGGHELGYWIAPGHWGRGFATEAGRAVVAIARDSLRLPKLRAGHFTDNPASGRVLAKLGFRPTGVTAPRHSLGRGRDVPCRLFDLDLAGTDGQAAAEADTCPVLERMVA